jgi:sugar lactone lactonase YvrE
MTALKPRPAHSAGVEPTSPEREHVGGTTLNAPNDVVVSSDGAVWFTDPGYGSMSDYEGDQGELELPTRVYRIDPDRGEGSQSVYSLYTKATGL